MITEEIIEFVTADILEFHNQLEHNNDPIKTGIRDIGLLESAINAPFQSFDGIPLIPNTIERAAKLCYGILKNHAFIDGNKRTATHSLLCYLAINGLILIYTNNELQNKIISIASNDLTVENFTVWLKDNIVDIKDVDIKNMQSNYVEKNIKNILNIY